MNAMRRREFIALLGGAAAAWPHTARAQQAARVATVGFLNFENPEPIRALITEGLRDLGYVEGRNIRYEYRSAEGNRDRLAGFAAEFIRLKVDVIVAYPTPAVLATMQATKAIPIVLAGAGDPVGTGFIASLARPGGNVTGTSSTAAELGPKTLEVIRDIMPSVRRVAVLANAHDPFSKSFLEQMQIGGQTLRIEHQTITIRAPEELEPAFASMKKDGLEAVVLQPSLPRRRIAELALQHRVPSISPTGAFAAEGGLAAYAASRTEMARKTAGYIDRILKGSKPADLPVEQPTKFELVINLKTAKAIGIDVPAPVLNRADEVIE